MARRATLATSPARSEGVRLLRVLTRRFGYERIARLIGVDESSIRKWAHQERTPSAAVSRWTADTSREAMDRTLGIPMDAWDELPLEAAAALEADAHARGLTAAASIEFKKAENELARRGRR